MKYYFGYYYFNGTMSSYKRNEDSPRSPGATHEVEISKEQYRLSLAFLEHRYLITELKSL